MCDSAKYGHIPDSTNNRDSTMKLKVLAVLALLIMPLAGVAEVVKFPDGIVMEGRGIETPRRQGISRENSNLVPGRQG